MVVRDGMFADFDERQPVGNVWFSPEALPFQVLILLGGIFLGWILSRFVPARQQRFIFLLFVFGFLSRIVACYFLYLLSWLSDTPGAFLGADDYSYMHTSLGFSRLFEAGIKVDPKIASGWTEQSAESEFYQQGFIFIPELFRGNPYMKFNIFLFQWLGHHPLSVLAVNCLLGALVIFPLFFLVRDIFNSRSAKVAAVLGAFYPSAFLWSTQNLKEALFNFLAMSLFFSFMRFRKTYHLTYLIPMGGAVCLISFLRSPFHLILIGGLLVGSCLTNYRMCLAVAAAIFVLSFHSPQIFQEQIAQVESRVFQMASSGALTPSQVQVKEGPPLGVVENFNRLRRERTAGTTVLEDFKFDGWQSLSYLSLLFIVITLTVPYPWMISGGMMVFSMIEILLWYALIPATLWGIGYGLRKRFSLTITLLLPVMLYALTLGITCPNVGLVVRLRGIVFLVLFAFAGAGFLYRKTKVKAITGVSYETGQP